MTFKFDFMYLLLFCMVAKYKPLTIGAFPRIAM